MKKTILFLAMLMCISILLYAQPPQAFKYQAVVRDAAGEIISNQAVDIRISIHDVTPGGTVIYVETFPKTTNQFGLVNLEIGTGTPVSGTFSGIDWGKDSKFIEVEIDASGGGYISMGTSELLAVPYALFSDRSSLVSNKGTGNIYVGEDVAPISTGYSNAFMGYQSGYSNTTGYVNTFIGHQSGYTNSTGAGNTFIGYLSGFYNTTGTLNTIIGDRSGLMITEGNRNTYLGYKSGHENTIGSGNICIGYKAGYYATGDNKLYIHNESSNSPLIYGEFDNSLININGKVGIGTTTPDVALHVNDRIRIGEDPSYSTVFGELIHEGGGTGFIINAHAGGGGWADMLFQTNANTRMFIESGGNVGIGTTSPSSKLDVRGNVTIRSASTGSIVMELGTGLDYAEGFNVLDNAEIKPGTILCIDTKNHGNLKISEKPYDKTVAGIVAGANGLGSGVRLGTDDFDVDVALAGRVYCNVDATSEKIEAGDLLTTSSIPGFAMKVTDFDNARGAILGKAMESLEKGKTGQILVLITLQ